MRFLAHAIAAVFALSAAGAFAAGPTGLLNDTGQTSCYDASNAAVACSAGGVGSDFGANPRQDARFGRDAKPGLAKIGGGAAGFDFTKVCANGDLAGQGSCAANPQTTDANPWACTKDNVTNLYWSIESVGGYVYWTGSDFGWNDYNGFDVISIVVPDFKTVI